MKNVKGTLSHFVRAAMKAKEMREHYARIGLDDDPPFQIWGEILDGIYVLIGEHTNEFEKSTTYITMTAPLLTEERRVEMLYGEYQKHFPDSVQQPAPHTFSRKDMRNAYKASGGYMVETPEGGWS